jgi:uncharacterized repeat protein (TIGR01451 family)
LLQTALFPDVTITKPPNVTIPIGSPGNYTVTVNNTGGAPAPNVTLVEVLPPGVVYVSGPPECTATGQTITCNIGTIPPGGSKDVPIVVKPTDPGPFTTTGNVTADNEQNTANSGPVNTTITVMRTCAVYNGDGSSFPCGANTVPNANNSQSTSPSNSNCCVSLSPGAMCAVAFVQSASIQCLSALRSTPDCQGVARMLACMMIASSQHTIEAETTPLAASEATSTALDKPPCPELFLG